MSALFWIAIFLISLGVMIKGADWFLASSERIGVALRISPFIIGVTIVAMGTSLPELVSSLFAVARGAGDVVVANAVGSNIANIFLVIGLSATLGKKLLINKNLIDLDIPLLAITTSIFFFMIKDGSVLLGESIVLLVSFAIYLLYTILHHDEPHESEVLQEHLDIAEKKHALEPLAKITPKVRGYDIVLLILGGIGLILGAKFLIDAVIALSEIYQVGTGVIAVSAIALGTSLPELIVSVRAAMQGKSAIAIGNIFGSNIFNMLMVVGIPGLLGTLPVDPQTLTLALPFMIVSTILFMLSGISRRIYNWEGIFFLVLYVIFLGQLFGFL
ncbi:MAG: cation:H+ antiporter [Planctomycetota bacterium]|jgi:cation:H+ antiporter